VGSLRNPVGSLPSSIHWRRRAVVLCVLPAPEESALSEPMEDLIRRLEIIRFPVTTGGRA
jgi:hypothetical protein